MLIFLLKLFISLGQCFLFVCDWKRPKSNKHTKSTNLRIEVYFTERKKCDKNKCFLFPVVFLRENRHKYVFLFIVDLSKLWRQHWRRDSSIRVLYPRDICHAWSVTPIKRNQDSLGFWRCGFRIPGSWSGFFVGGTWIPGSLHCIPQFKSIPDFRFHKQNFPDFEIRILLYGARSDISGRSRPLHWALLLDCSVYWRL